MSENIRKLVAIVGPTASGKTGVGVRLAKKIGGLPANASRQLMPAGEIISADSRQVYRGLDIGSGKDLETYNNVVYHLIDVADPGERFTLFDWLEQARAAIDDIFTRGKVPIVVGGTGLYVSALVEGFQLKAPNSKFNVQQNSKFQIPINQYTRQELDGMALEGLQELFCKLKIENCKIDVNNPRRLIRAIEKAQTGESIENVKPDFESIVIGIDRDRAELYKRIDLDADQRFKEGMLEETRNLLKSGISEEWLISLGLDYKNMTQYLLEMQELGSWYKVVGEEQTEKYKEMVERFKFAEHDYARRQLVWWRKRDVQWVKDYVEVEKLAKKFLKTAS